ncbi:MAG: Endopeptidase YgjD [Evtepia sp.]|jgi:N6-L-threonylcarbamoyladenine synthase|nr:Endopeptidase YgjD [Evtepia sp.]
MTVTLGIDTSNYTTSVAFFDGTNGRNIGQLLDVPEGSLGLRQSDALFQHVKRLPNLIEALKGAGLPTSIQAIGVSTRPREVEGSYMPCFLAGESQGRVLAQVIGIPFYPCSHQQGHVAAAAWSAGHMDLLDHPHLAWHLSGGTTELLYVEPDGVLVHAKQIGGSSDISAGQLIDRTGKRLGLAFPAGKAVDALSLKARKALYFPVKVQKMKFSLSGIENQMNALAEQGESPAEICRFVLGSILYAVDVATRNALSEYPGLPVLCAGGVASNRLLRDTMRRSHGALFAEAAYSTDNAMGVAILAFRMLEKERNHG